MITIEEYLGQHGKGHEAELSSTMKANANALCWTVNRLLLDFGEAREMRSGWRPQSVNDATPNAAHRSLHITCEAIDLEDEDGRLKYWLAEDKLEKYNVFMEYGRATPGWCHLQIIPPHSGRLVFFPNATWAARAQQEDTA